MLILNQVNQKIYDSEPTVRGKSDIVRYEILYQFGGMYIDADSLCLHPQKSLNQLIKNNRFFAAKEPRNKQFIANGVIYCQPNCQIINQMNLHLHKKYYHFISQ